MSRTERGQLALPVDARASVVDVAEAMPGSASVYIDRIFPAWCAARRITPAEARLLRHACEGTTTRRELAACVGRQATTIKNQIRSLCRKAGAPTLRDAVVLVLRAALEPLRPVDLASPSGSEAGR